PSSPAAAHTRPSGTTPRNRKTGAGGGHEPRRGTAPPRASAPALQFFCDQVLHRRVVQRQLRIHPLELGVLRFQVLDPSQVRRLHPAVLRLPLVVRRRTDPRLPAEILHRNPGITLLEDRDDLSLAELRLLHGTSWLKRCQKVLLVGCPGSGGAYGGARHGALHRQARETRTEAGFLGTSWSSPAGCGCRCPCLPPETGCVFSAFRLW